MTQEQLALAAGFNGQSRIGNYERGGREPSLADASAIAKALGVTTAEILDIDFPSQPARLSGDIIRTAYREAAEFAAQGGAEADDFNPGKNPDDAGILALVLNRLLATLVSTTSAANEGR